MYQHLSQFSANGSLCMLDMKLNPDGNVAGLSAKSGKAEELIQMQALVNEREKMQIELEKMHIEQAQVEQGSYKQQAELLNSELGATLTKLAECDAERQRLHAIAFQQSEQIARGAKENEELMRINHLLGAQLTAMGIDVADVLRGNVPAVVPRLPAAPAAPAAMGGAAHASDPSDFVIVDDDRSASYSDALGIRGSPVFKAGNRRAARPTKVKQES
jgi:hypothetical protein